MHIPDLKVFENSGVVLAIGNKDPIFFKNILEFLLDKPEIYHRLSDILTVVKPEEITDSFCEGLIHTLMPFPKEDRFFILLATAADKEVSLKVKSAFEKVPLFLTVDINIEIND